MLTMDEAMAVTRQAMVDFDPDHPAFSDFDAYSLMREPEAATWGVISEMGEDGFRLPQEVVDFWYHELEDYVAESYAATDALLEMLEDYYPR